MPSCSNGAGDRATKNSGCDETQLESSDVSAETIEEKDFDLSETFEEWKRRFDAGTNDVKLFLFYCLSEVSCFLLWFRRGKHGTFAPFSKRNSKKT